MLDPGSLIWFLLIIGSVIVYMSKHRLGKIHKGHFSPWISQSINMLRIELGHKPIDDDYTNRLGSTFDCQHTIKTFGIVPFCHRVLWHRSIYILPIFVTQLNKKLILFS
ncbi:hypothetical protein K501DRAFT_279839 [Backusella circina FSU 941]|nr:hypothetical protein K501DRAFT_279839 [Backusella circina FSU 941]